MRASATSRIASSASFAASQAKTNTSPADSASPFALLVNTVAPKDPTRDAKPSQKDNSQDTAGADDKQDVQQDTNAGPAQTAPQPSDKTPPVVKAAGKDKDASDDQADQTNNDAQLAAATLQLLNLQAVPAQPPAPQAQTPAPQAPATPSDQDNFQIDATTPAATAKSPSGVPSGVPSAPVKPGLAPAAKDGQPDDKTVAAASELQAPVPAPKSNAPQSDGKPVTPDANTQAPDVVTAKPNAVSALPANKDPVNKDDAKSGTDAAVQNSVAANDAPAGKPQTAKADAVKPTRSDKAAPSKTDLAKAHLAKDQVTQQAKTNPDKGDADKIAQSAAPQTDAEETGEAAPAAKPAPQPVAAANGLALSTGLTSDGLAAGQISPGQNMPANLAAAPQITQHIQVTATAAPNLPALAVEISAKSQSGSKQFDIRLDPPELGRVEVRLSIDTSGKASAHLSADQPQTLALLQKDAPVLARALRDAGLDVSQDGLNFSLRQQTGSQTGNDGQGSGRGGSRNFSLAATTSIDATALTASYRGPADGRLDIRV